MTRRWGGKEGKGKGGREGGRDGEGEGEEGVRTKEGRWWGTEGQHTCYQ